jgi:multidrug efflux pump subunit AcrB
MDDRGAEGAHGLGLTGRLARAFIDSKLTPLIMAASLLLGAVAVLKTPREEEPQIVVPLADVFIPFPGAAANEVEELVVRPLERKLSEIPGVEYLYTTSRPGMALFIVRFYVGEQMEKSLVDLYDKLMSNRDLLPPGAQEFQVKPRDINDVPIVTLTLWSERYDDVQLRSVAQHVLEEIKKIPKTSGGFIVGGRQREWRVEPDPARLRMYALTPLEVADAIRAANQNIPAGRFERANREYLVETGDFLQSREALEQVVVGVGRNGRDRDGRDRPVFVRDVAQVIDGPQEPERNVWFGSGPRAAAPVRSVVTPGRDYPAVTVAVAKLPGTNAVEVSRAVMKKVDELKGRLIPSDLHVTVTRDYGRTADEKADELLKHLFYAVAAVVVFLGFVLGLREAGVVSLAIPLTLALTLFVSMMIGYTINRVTLFALIFSIGILVDDAIVVVENIYRRLSEAGARPGSTSDHRQAAVAAVDEVGNPTILATLTVIAALLPMAFISGLMGPYMRPIPVNASIAMFFSLLVAVIVVPWFCRICYRRRPGAEPAPAAHGRRGASFYGRLLTPLLDRRSLRNFFLGGVALLLAASLSLFYFKLVVMKMLPFDNKSELQLVIDMPEGTPLEETARAAKALSEYVGGLPEVAHYQAYVGTASPFNFNGLVRHYFLRESGNMADIQITLVDKHERAAQSHEIARRIRPEAQAIARRFGANVKVVEVPPGPPVQSALVAEIYGPDDRTQTETARAVRGAFEATPGVVDVDDSLEADQTKYRFVVDKVKASLAGVSTDEVVRTLLLALEGETVGLAHLPQEKAPVVIRVRLPRPLRSGVEELQQIALRHSSGGTLPLSELVRVREERQDQSIDHNNLKSVIYVTGDVAGSEESPLYGILKIGRRLDASSLSDGRPIGQAYTRQPASEARPVVKWDGEWQITYETFRDMGLAFGVALVLIYLLIVGQFQSFLLPLIIMAPIPLTLIGIVPGHWLTGSYFTATSMIGFIALAGIIVRNSILLVDFIETERRAGAPLREAVIRAGTIRIRPILLTAAALMVGAFVIILDPIFQGLAISLLFGVFASTLLTLVVIPVLYYMLASVGQAGG